jgi:hypothetical protein
MERKRSLLKAVQVCIAWFFSRVMTFQAARTTRKSKIVRKSTVIFNQTVPPKLAALFERRMMPAGHFEFGSLFV